MDSTDLAQLARALELLKPGRLLVVVVGFLVIGALTKTIEGFSRKAQLVWPRHRLLALQLSTIVNFAIYIFGGIVLVYAVLQPPKEILVAIAGSAAVAVGFSLKDIVASIIAGVILLFDRPFQVGDRVTFAGSYGEIVGIGLRTVKLLTLDDSLVTIPNSRFLTETAASGNAGALDMMVVCDFHVALDADLDRVKEICYAVAATSRFVYLKKPVTILASEVALAERLALRVRVKAYVLDCRYEKAFETDVVSRVTKLLAAGQIARPTRA
jgi:small-conductance mechanosensitive channel